MKLYLIGFMGAGKTTVGRLVAERTGVPFYDLDELIEASQRCSVREIFERAGEAEFRRIERDLLQQTRFLGDSVIATGGGTFAIEGNVLFIKSEGLSVHLSVPFDVLWHRVGDKAATRPLFRDYDAALKLYQYRAKYYTMADRTIEIREADHPADVAARVVTELALESSRGSSIDSP